MCLPRGQGGGDSFYLQQLKWGQKEQTSSWKIENLLEKRKERAPSWIPSYINALQELIWVVVLPVFLRLSLPLRHDFLDTIATRTCINVLLVCFTFFAFQNHLDSAIAKTLKALKTSYSLKSDSSKKHLSIPSLSLDDTPISSAPFTSKITSLPQKNQHSLKIYLISSRICTWLGLYNLTELYGQLFQAVLSLRGSLFSHCS